MVAIIKLYYYFIVCPCYALKPVALFNIVLLTVVYFVALFDTLLRLYFLIAFHSSYRR